MFYKLFSRETPLYLTELLFIQLHQITLQKKNNINKKQIIEKHFKLKNFFTKNSFKKAAAISLRSANILKNLLKTHKHKTNET